MKLFKIEQTINTAYDTYDSAVVAAQDAEEARRLHPDGDRIWVVDGGWHLIGTDAPLGDSGAWCAPKHVTATLIGEALEGTPRSVIVASFNAG